MIRLHHIAVHALRSWQVGLQTADRGTVRSGKW